MLLNSFDLTALHPVAHAGSNHFSVGIVHPTRFINEHLFIYMLDGSWELWQDDERYLLKKGDLFIYAANHLEHGKLPCAPGTATIYFHVTGAPTDELVRESDDASAPGRVLIPTLMHIAHDPDLLDYFKKMIVIHNSESPNAVYEASSVFNLLVCHLRDFAANNYIRTDVVDTVLFTIHTHPEKFFSLDELATLSFVSRRTLSRLIKERTGLGVHAYQMNQKLEQAARQLSEQSDRSLSELAGDLGFYDVFHFSKQFKKKYGVSPTQYRKRY
ncbi:MAG: helix-turn-helix domain-containing protein [Eubacteriales bacterium]|nr:helix-turn-helix domain-containing protein [Eubacteriales bacterium]